MIILIEDDENDALQIHEPITDTGPKTEITCLSDGRKTVEFFNEGMRSGPVSAGH